MSDVLEFVEPLNLIDALHGNEPLDVIDFGDAVVETKHMYYLPWYPDNAIAIGWPG